MSLARPSSKESLEKGGVKGEVTLVALLNLKCLLDSQVDGSSKELYIRIWSSGRARDKILGGFNVDRSDQMKKFGS